MSSARSAAGYVGRVGGLAVALGIGLGLAAAAPSAFAQDNADAPSAAQGGGQPSGRGGGAAEPGDRAAAKAGPQRSDRGVARGAASPAHPAQADSAHTAAADSAHTAKADSGAVATTRSAALAVTPAALTPAPASSVTVPAPTAPAGSIPTSALAPWTRRGADRTVVRSSAATRVETVTTPTAAVVAPRSLASNQLGWVTGQRNTAFPGSTWEQTNNTRWANIYGTDLGIMWFNGENNLTQLAFGDTFSGPNMSGTWINNALLLSDDTELYDGLTLINTGPAFQFIPDARNAVFIIGSEVTNIPTAAVYANGQNYVNYMSVKSWDTPGRWTTNYSAVSMYDPQSDTWVLQRSTIRSAGWFRSSTRYQAGDQNFQQMAYVLQPESRVVDGEPRYLYAFGTPSGRAGSAFLSRVPEGAITDLRQYEYWDGEGWVRDRPAVAVRVIGDSDRSAGLFGFVRDLANNPNFFGGWFAGLVGAKTGGNVSEMSVQYNEYLDKYVAMYGDGLNNIQLRTADTPEGPWSDPIQVATSLQYPGLYAPMIHPLSGTGALTDASGDPDVSTLYWNMSIWSNYNVVLMKTDLTPLKTTLV